MNKKVTWKMIFDDFKNRHPNLSKQVVRYFPSNYLTIEVWIKDGLRIKYDYWEHKGYILDGDWRELEGKLYGQEN